MWPAVRRAWLKQHPQCAACGHAGTNDVHHLKPFHLFPELELAPANLMTACRSCHLVIAHLNSWQSYNPDAVADAAAHRVKVARRPEM